MQHFVFSNQFGESGQYTGHAHLYNYISLSVNELDKIVNQALNNWFDNDLNEIYEVNYPTVWHNVKTFVDDNDGEYEYCI